MVCLFVVITHNIFVGVNWYLLFNHFVSVIPGLFQQLLA